MTPTALLGVALTLAPAAPFEPFERPARQPLPEVGDADWPRQRIDRFVLARLETAGGTHSAEAGRAPLLRRLTFDLTGLPPKPEDTSAFASDGEPDAYERRVDRLLASPGFGERWARPWLDLARYAEDQAHIVGDNKSLFYPNAYLYRDWVIAAFNADMPYDEFVKRQLADDLIDPDDDSHRVALGFIGLGPKYYQRNAPEVMAEEWEDRVDVVTRGLLGLTAACARCHDHKYDPIPTADYYALAGVFAGTEMFNRPLDDKTPKEKDGRAKSPEQAMHIVRDGKPTDLHVFIRGNVKDKGELAPRRFLGVLSNGEPKPFSEGSGRRELAEAIASAENPLTARVIVNRVWGEMFGGYLVGTPSNFGELGEPPSHPRLLDDLAVRLVDSGWSVKELVRELALSATYRQSADGDPAPGDAANRLLGRMNRKRLTAEMWRDAILWSSGWLERTVGGESIDPREPAERRRTVYSRISRLDLDRMLRLFDMPDPNGHAARRVETTTPLQKLFVLNSEFMDAQAEAFAGRVCREADAEADRVRLAYRLAYGREPGDAELRLGLAFLEGGDSGERWRRYAQVLLASNEMAFVD